MVKHAATVEYRRPHSCATTARPWQLAVDANDTSHHTASTHHHHHAMAAPLTAYVKHAEIKTIDAPLPPWTISLARLRYKRTQMTQLLVGSWMQTPSRFKKLLNMLERNCDRFVYNLEWIYCLAAKSTTKLLNRRLWVISAPSPK